MEIIKDQNFLLLPITYYAIIFQFMVNYAKLCQTKFWKTFLVSNFKFLKFRNLKYSDYNLMDIQVFSFTESKQNNLPTQLVHSAWRPSAQFSDFLSSLGEQGGCSDTAVGSIMQLIILKQQLFSLMFTIINKSKYFHFNNLVALPCFNVNNLNYNFRK